MKKGRTSAGQRKKAIVATIITEILIITLVILLFAVTGNFSPLLVLVLFLVVYVTTIVFYAMIYNYIFQVAECEYEEEMERNWAIVRQHLKKDEYIELDKTCALEPDAPMQRAIVLEGEKNIRYFAKMVDDDKAEMILRNRENRIVYQVIITNPKFIMRQFDYH